MRGIHRWPVNSPHKWPVTRKMFPFVDVIMNINASPKPHLKRKYLVWPLPLCDNGQGIWTTVKIAFVLLCRMRSCWSPSGNFNMRFVYRLQSMVYMEQNAFRISMVWAYNTLISDTNVRINVMVLAQINEINWIRITWITLSHTTKMKILSKGSPVGIIVNCTTNYMIPDRLKG